MKPQFQIRGLRWWIVILLCLSTQLNYLDRQTLSILAKTIQEDLKLTTSEYSNITTAFLVSYTIMYVVSGRIVDRLGSRRSLLIFAGGWSVANLLHAFARSALQFSIFRFLLGATEPGNFPAGIRAVSEWFPVKERALAVGIFNGGAAIGSAIAAPVVSYIAINWGWRNAFVFGGFLGLIWVLIFAAIYRLPAQHAQISSSELELISAGEDANSDNPAKPFLSFFTLRPVWGCIIVRMLLDPVSYFFIFWIPLFLQKERGFDLADIGRYSGIPFVALALGNIAGGLLPRTMIARGFSLNFSRKAVMLTASCLMPLFCLWITRISTPGAAIALISCAMFFHGAWAFMALPSEIFPREHVGTVTGIAGTMGGLMGVVSQKLIGWVVETNSFAPIFTVCAFVYLLAFGAVWIFIGDLGRRTIA